MHIEINGGSEVRGGVTLDVPTTHDGDPPRRSVTLRGGVEVDIPTPQGLFTVESASAGIVVRLNGLVVWRSHDGSVSAVEVAAAAGEAMGKGPRAHSGPDHECG